MTTPDADLALLRAVAEQVMGCKPEDSWSGRDRPCLVCRCAPDNLHANRSGHDCELPDWLGRDWEQVVERMRELGWRLTLQDLGDSWSAAFALHVALAPTIGEAVCRAAMRAESDTPYAGGPEA